MQDELCEQLPSPLPHAEEKPPPLRFAWRKPMTLLCFPSRGGGGSQAGVGGELWVEAAKGRPSSLLLTACTAAPSSDSQWFLRLWGFL